VPRCPCIGSRSLRGRPSPPPGRGASVMVGFGGPLRPDASRVRCARPSAVPLTRQVRGASAHPTETCVVSVAEQRKLHRFRRAVSLTAQVRGSSLSRNLDGSCLMSVGNSPSVGGTVRVSLGSGAAVPCGGGGGRERGLCRGALASARVRLRGRPSPPPGRGASCIVGSAGPLRPDASRGRCARPSAVPLTRQVRGASPTPRNLRRFRWWERLRRRFRSRRARAELRRPPGGEDDGMPGDATGWLVAGRTGRRPGWAWLCGRAVRVR
jgi:hypothetical protein